MARAAEAHAAESAAFAEAIRRGLGAVKWLGRVQKLAEKPAVYVDGAITVPSAESFVASLSGRLSEPVLAIVGVPRDRDYAGVYAVMATVSRTLIITETDINPNTRFPAREDALRAARDLAEDAHHTRDLTQALELARARAGESGTILLAGVADARWRSHANLASGYDGDLNPRLTSCRVARIDAKLTAGK